VLFQKKIIVLAAAALYCVCALAGELDAQWRKRFNVHEADPIAMTGPGIAGAPDGFAEPDALAFVKRNGKLRGALVATDIRFEDGQPSKSRLNIYDAAGPYKEGRMRLIATHGEGVFVGKPKSVAENSKGQFIVSDGFDLKDKVSDELRKTQGLHLFGEDFKKLRSFGQNTFESVNGVAVDRQDRIYVTERSKGHVRRFSAQGELDTGWQIIDTEVKKSDNMIIAEDLTVGGVTGVFMLSDEDRGMVRFYALADGRFLNVVLGNSPTCQPAAGEKLDTCFRKQSVFNGNVEGMVRHGHYLIVMDEADKPLEGKEDGGVIWFFDMRDGAMFNQTAGWFAGRRDTGLRGGIHKWSPHTQSKIEKQPELAPTLAGGTFISADSIDITEVNGKRLLAVANQGLFRLELFDLDKLMALVGADGRPLVATVRP
jgi:hypothetical protein